MCNVPQLYVLQNTYDTQNFIRPNAVSIKYPDSMYVLMSKLPGMQLQAFHFK